MFNSSLYLAVSTSSLARPVRSLQSNAIFNQPSACHFTAEEIGKKWKGEKHLGEGQIGGKGRDHRNRRYLKKCHARRRGRVKCCSILLSAERSDWVTVWGCGGSWRVDIRYILGGVGEVIDWRLNSFTAGNWSPPSPTSSTQCLSQSAATN